MRTLYKNPNATRTAQTRPVRPAGPTGQTGRPQQVPNLAVNRDLTVLQAGTRSVASGDLLVCFQGMIPAPILSLTAAAFLSMAGRACMCPSAGLENFVARP